VNLRGSSRPYIELVSKRSLRGVIREKGQKWRGGDEREDGRDAAPQLK